MLTELDSIKAAISDDALFQRALTDFIETAVRITVVGHSLPASSWITCGSSYWKGLIMDDQRSQFAEEKAALEQDMIRRAREIEAERVLAEARQAIAPVAKSYTPPRRRAAAAPAADMTAAWRDYIDARIKRAEARTTRACMAAVGEVIGKDMVTAERRIEQLEREVAELRERLEQDQRGARLRTVPSPTALIA
jgi:hypothetical protein